MRKIFFILSLLLSQYLLAQTNQLSTNEITITGKVKNDRVITLSDLQKYPAIELSDINTSCSPKREEKAKSVKVVLVKNILDSVKFDYENSHMLGQYYFVFIASDGYKLVFSFNEIFNTEVGNHLYVITEMNEKKITEMDSRIMLLSTKDIKGGSRNMKGLAKIIVCSAQ